MSTWKSYLLRFHQYLLLERSLSKNSIEAYEDDLKKLNQYSALFLSDRTPEKLTPAQLEKFVEWVAELGFSTTSQARIISGIKAFYKFLLVENDLKDSPA